VIRLRNHAVPIIAIQLSAFRLGDEIVLQFTCVLDADEFSAEPEEEEIAEQVDRAYWQRKANPESLAVVDAIRADSDYERRAENHLQQAPHCAWHNWLQLLLVQSAQNHSPLPHER